MWRICLEEARGTINSELPSLWSVGKFYRVGRQHNSQSLVAVLRGRVCGGASWVSLSICDCATVTCEQIAGGVWDRDTNRAHALLLVVTVLNLFGSSPVRISAGRLAILTFRTFPHFLRHRVHWYVTAYFSVHNLTPFLESQWIKGRATASPTCTALYSHSEHTKKID